VSEIQKRSNAYIIASNLRQWSREDLKGYPDSRLQATGGFIAARFVEAQEQRIQQLERELTEAKDEVIRLRDNVDFAAKLLTDARRGPIC